MPHMERLTWQGVALHAGNLPGYPASHGCVRLPAKFAENLYGVTQVGTPVIIAGDVSDPAAVKDPGPILGSSAKETIETNVGKEGGFVAELERRHLDPGLARRQAHLCVAERRHRCRRRGENQRPVKGARLERVRLAGRRPQGLDLGGDGLPGRRRRAGCAQHRRTRAHRGLARGDGRHQEAHEARQVLVTTDFPATPDTRSDKSFVVMDGRAK
jgi:hypothetical protein